MNVKLAKIVQEESATIAKAIEQLPEDKHEIAYALFFLWKNLNPLSIWRKSREEGRFIIKTWKSIIFAKTDIPENFEHYFSIYDILGDYQKFLKNDLMLEILNAIEASLYRIGFMHHADLLHFLNKTGGNMALLSANILFQQEFKNNQIIHPELVLNLGRNILHLEMLKHTAWLVDREKFLIALEDLNEFECREEDLIARVKEPKIKKLSQFQLERLKEDLYRMQKIAYLEPNVESVQETINFITSHCCKEIECLRNQKWLIVHEDPPRYVIKESKFTISKISSLFSQKSEKTSQSLR